MTARSNSSHEFTAQRPGTFGAAGQGGGKDALLYVPDDYGLGVEIDPGLLDCRSLVACTELFRVKKFAIATN